MLFLMKTTNLNVYIIFVLLLAVDQCNCNGFSSNVCPTCYPGNNNPVPQQPSYNYPTAGSYGSQLSNYAPLQVGLAPYAVQPPVSPQSSLYQPQSSLVFIEGPVGNGLFSGQVHINLTN